VEIRNQEIIVYKSHFGDQNLNQIIGLRVEIYSRGTVNST